MGVSEYEVISSYSAFMSCNDKSGFQMKRQSVPGFFVMAIHDQIRSLHAELGNLQLLIQRQKWARPLDDLIIDSLFETLLQQVIGTVYGLRTAGLTNQLSGVLNRFAEHGTGARRWAQDYSAHFCLRS